ncbi:unnamed protein product [Chilo suppressalis]|uniref:PPIase cyclophilin-type domain-containing protein n=1 Tax=Chilo suppressalis TaxID=168631 RepID=A0ABN8AWQ3_CHISP|nr:unnamed protein product [Chilo suppressalis]
MSTLFNMKPPVGEKQIASHPWEKIIKDVHCDKMKFAHNSVNNPHYPMKKKKLTPENIVKFRVIGDRVTKEFIYCVNLVSGLHKYRWKKFDVPEIRGVTSVEWPEIWHNLKVKYGGLTHCLQSRVAVLMNDTILGGEKELKELIESKYIYHLQLNYYNEAVANFATYIRSSGRPCAYMHISINKEHIGTMIFMLYSDLVPYTCDNFLRLCNQTKGGYSGTPIHRIVADGWIQCGGFGLKSVDLECENFIVPHDRRGVLCMANDGRHVDCSTQFFVLLQPAPWMAHKYVAFGVLIEGEKTLDRIEKEPTWYESPISEITIYKAGILNMECHDITVNKSTNEYIHGHIEDLYSLGELLIETLIQRVFLEAELKLVQRLENELLGESEEILEEGGHGEVGNIHRTRRFIRKGEMQEDTNSHTEHQHIRNQSIKSATVKVVPLTSKDSEQENNEFDVEEYEMEESVYQHMSIVSESIVVKPEKPYYIPLTDVLYPGEKDSTYDLKKFLRGDYCLESDIDPERPKLPRKAKPNYPSALLKLSDDVSESASSQSLDSEDEKEVREYLRNNADQVSFAGEIIKSIAREHKKINLFEGEGKPVQITEEQLRKVRLASVNHKAAHDTKVTIDVPSSSQCLHHKQIKRRQTGFVHHKIFDKTESEASLEEDEQSRTVRISASATVPPPPGHHTVSGRRPTGFIRMMEIGDPDSETNVPEREQRDSHSHRPSILQRLYDSNRIDEHGPTLKGHRAHSDVPDKHLMLTYSPHGGMKSEESVKKLVLRKPQSTNADLEESVLDFQYNKKLVRKFSSDYVKTFSQMHNKFENSIRSIEYAKTRPAMTVSDYQERNQLDQKLKDQMEQKDDAQSPVKNDPIKSKRGLRLPGDSPLYSKELSLSRVKSSDTEE